LNRLKETLRIRRNERVKQKSLRLLRSYIRYINRKKDRHIVVEGYFLHIVKDEKIKIWEEMEKQFEHINIIHACKN